MTFQELAKIQRKALSKQRGFTYEEMLAIQKKIEKWATSKNKKTK